MAHEHIKNTSPATYLLYVSLLVLTPFIEGPVSLEYLTLVSLIAAFAFYIYIISSVSRGRLRLLISPINLLLFSFLFIILLSRFYSVNPSSTSYNMIAIGSLIIIGTLLSTFKQTDEAWIRLFRVLIILSTLFCLLGFFQYFVLYERARGPFFVSNTFAGYLLTITPLLISLFFFLKSTKDQKIFLLLIAIHYGAILASGSRGGWIGLFFGLVLLGYLVRTNSLSVDRRRIISLSIVMAIITILFFWSYEPKGKDRSKNIDRVKSVVAMSKLTNDRIDIWKNSAKLIKDRPFFGTGFWTFHAVYQVYKDNKFKKITHPFAHNDYIQFAVELGITGLLVFLGFLYFYFRDGTRIIGNKKNTLIQKGILIGVMASSAAMLTHSMFDFNLYIPAILLNFFAYAGYVISSNSDNRLYKTLNLELANSRLFNLLGKRKTYIMVTFGFFFAVLWLLNPYRALLYNEKGIQHVNKKEFRKALLQFSKAIETEPLYPGYHSNLANIFIKLTNDTGGLERDLYLAKAEEEIKQTIKLDRYNSQFYTDLASLYMTFYKDDKAHEAIKLLKKARDIAPTDSMTTFNLAKGFMETGNYKDAIVELSRYINDNNDDTKALLGLTEAYHKNGEYINALKAVDYLIEINNNNYYHFLKGNILRDMERYSDAVDEYKLALGEKGREAEVWYTIAELRVKQGNVNKAEDAFKEALKYYRDDIKTINSLGKLYLKQGRKGLALKEFRSSIALNPNQPEIEKIISYF